MAGNGGVQIIVGNHLPMAFGIGHADQHIQIVAVISIGRNDVVIQGLSVSL